MTHQFSPDGNGFLRAVGRTARGLAPVLAFTGACMSAAAADDGPLRLVWQEVIPETSAPYLASAAGNVLISTTNGELRALSAGSGEPAWSRLLAGGLAGAPVEVSDRIAVPAQDRTLLILDGASGETVGSYVTRTLAPLLVETPPGLLIADRDGGVGLISFASGIESWNATLPAPATTAGMCGDQLMVGMADGSLALLNPADGAISWNRPLGGPITTPPLCRDRSVWIGSADNRLYALRLRRRGCRMRGSFRTGGDLTGAPIAFGERLLFFSYDTYVYSIDAGNGHLTWKARLGLRPADRAVLAGSLLLIAARNAERLDIFRLPEGVQEPSWGLETGRERFVTPPLLAGDVIVAGAAFYGRQSSRLIALGLATTDP